MRIVSLVPSWTETLLTYDLDVVGRTRFCIHPESKVSALPVMGGTKDVKWERIKDLRPDLVIADKEENLQEIETQCPCPWIATQINSVRDMPSEMNRLSNRLQLSSDHPFRRHGLEWQTLMNLSLSESSIENIPGVLNWVHPIDRPIKKIRYIIWKKPWMSVSTETFIGSVLSFLGYGAYLIKEESLYPVLQNEEMNEENTLYLFSSEPYPFFRAEEIEAIASLKVASALVDGEFFSWFGVRSYSFLKQNLLSSS